jgi:hypothetical protein
MAKKPRINVTPSSGNVFADIGVADPDEALAKAPLASRIREVVRRNRLTQVAAAAVMLLTRLGQHVEIVVRTRPPRRLRGRIRVVEARA